MRFMFALVVAAFSLVAGASAEDCPFDHAPDCGPGKVRLLLLLTSWYADWTCD